MKSVYLILPYSHPDELVREYRFGMANMASAALIKSGYNVFSPISHSHPIAKYLGNHNDSSFWCDIDEFWQRKCLALALLPLGGYKESSGVKREVELAHRIRQEFLIIDPKTFEIKPWDGVL